MGTKDGLADSAGLAGAAGLQARLAALLADVTGEPASSYGPTSSPGKAPGWDSVSNLSFIAAVEDELAVSITTAEAMGLKTLDDFVRLIGARLGAR